VRQTDITDGRIDWAGVPHCDLSDGETPKYALATDDLLIARLGSVGRAARVRDANGAVFAGYLVRFRANRGLADPVFLEYQLRSPMWWDYVNSVRSGAVQPTLNAQQMAGYRFELPSLPEQERIAASLATIDDKIDSNLRQLELTDGLIQAHWSLLASTAQPTRLLSELVSTQYGLTASADPSAVGPKFLRVTDINKHNWISWVEVPSVATEENSGKYRLRRGDLLVARMADPGKSAIYDDESVNAVFASYLVRLQASSYAHALYIYGFLKSELYARYAEGAMSGSVQKNMNARVIVGVGVPWPDEDELGRFADVAGALRDSINQLVHENHRLAEVRDALMPELLCGRIRVPQTGVGLAEASS
jgi:type I restriction enzyme S subunit